MIAEENLNCIELATNESVDHSIIWLHGLGADGSDFVPIIDELHLPQSFRARFVFPHAPVRTVTINNGYEMRAWFDIYSPTIESKIDYEGFKLSITAVETLILKEISRGIESKNIIIAGFSQGAAIALCTGLNFDKPLGGIIALSGYLPPDLIEKPSEANLRTPIFLAHGTDDPIVPYALGKSTYALLHAKEYNVTWRSYPMGHAVDGTEIADLSSWLQKIW